MKTPKFEITAIDPDGSLHKWERSVSLAVLTVQLRNTFRNTPRRILSVKEVI